MQLIKLAVLYFVIKTSLSLKILDEDAYGSYIVHPALNEKECLGTREYIPIPNDVTTNYAPCENLYPSLNSIARGVNIHHFQNNETDFHPHTRAVFFLTCPNGLSENQKFYKGYDVPAEILEIYSTPRMILRKNNLTDEELHKKLEVEREIQDLRNSYLFFLPKIGFHIDHRNEFTVMESVIVHQFQIVMRPNLEPTQMALDEYKSLPIIYKGNERKYFNFLSTFGSHYRRSSTMGGSYAKVVKSISYQDATGSRNIFRAASYERYYSEGGNIVVRDIDRWAETVENRSVPIDSQFVSLNVLLDPHDSNHNHGAFQRAIETEKTHFWVKKLYWQLRVTDCKNNLCLFLRKVMEQQQDHLCPSEGRVALVKTGIIDNQELTNFWVKCKMPQFYSPVEQDWAEVTRIYYLISNVCFTYSHKVRSCTQASWNMPYGISCVEFYSGENCRGTSTTCEIENKLSLLFQRNKSLKLC